MLNQYDSINYMQFVKRNLMPHMVRLGCFLLMSTNVFRKLRQAYPTKDIPCFPKLVKFHLNECIFSSIAHAFIQQVFIIIMNAGFVLSRGGVEVTGDTKI